jgi:hypothetical protein
MGSGGPAKGHADGPQLTAEPSTSKDPSRRRRRWQSFVGIGLIVAPFLPASNVFFWVRTWTSCYDEMITHLMASLHHAMSFPTERTAHSILSCTTHCCPLLRHQCVIGWDIHRGEAALCSIHGVLHAGGLLHSSVGG